MDVNSQFLSFGIDLDVLSRFCPVSVGNLTEIVTIDSVATIINELKSIPKIDSTNELSNKLRAMMTPRRHLNCNGNLSREIFRLFEYRWNTSDCLADVEGMKFNAFILRKGQDGSFDELNGRVVSQAKPDSLGFCGCSCAIAATSHYRGVPILQSFQMADLPQEAKEFGNALKAYRRVTNRKQNRVAVAFRLGSGEAISAEDWIVDHDGAHVDSHVTVAVRNSAGLVAEEIDDGTFVIPELLALNWELSPAMYVCSGDAEWRDDYFPVEEGWKDALATFDEVLQQGAFEDYLAIWRVHAILHEDRVGRSGRGAPADMMKPWLVLAIQTIEAYLRSDATDPNRAYPRARRALHFLRTF